MLLKDQIFTFNIIHSTPKLFEFYTGLDVHVFDSLYTYLQNKASRMQYFHGKRNTSVWPFNLEGPNLKSEALQEEFF